MPVVKKKASKKAIPKTIVVTKSKTASATSLFPQKLNKVNAMLAKARLLES